MLVITILTGLRKHIEVTSINFYGLVMGRIQIGYNKQYFSVTNFPTRGYCITIVFLLNCNKHDVRHVHALAGTMLLLHTYSSRL